MEVNVIDSRKTVEVWLTRAEASNSIVRHGLKAVYAKYKAQGYRVVVYESGQRDLYAATRDLILENRMPRPAPQKSNYHAR